MNGYIAYVLSEAERERLLARFPALYPDVIVHHITYRFPAGPDDSIPPETSGEIIGFADDGIGIQAAVVEVGGTARRPDGKTYHVTWSLDRQKGYTPVKSNDLITRQGFRPLDERVPITFRAEFLPAT